MFEIDKQKFGTFVAELRKEKGMTQKELAQQLFISDKAISKWETGNSVPDIALLIPLSDLFGVTVTELLMCQRMNQNNSMDTNLVENVVKTAICYTDNHPIRAYQVKSKWGIIYVLFFLITCIEFLFSYNNGYMTVGLIITTILSTIFGAYFCFFAITKLPAYYDENKIYTYSDVCFEMSIPGLPINNSNWSHILNVGRIWALVTMTVYPVLNYIMNMLLPNLWFITDLFAVLLFLLGGLFIPIYIVGKKHLT